MKTSRRSALLRQAHPYDDLRGAALVRRHHDLVALGLDGVQARELGPVVHEAQVPVDRLQRHVQVPAADQRPEVLADVAEALQL